MLSVYIQGDVHGDAAIRAAAEGNNRTSKGVDLKSTAPSSVI